MAVRRVRRLSKGESKWSSRGVVLGLCLLAEILFISLGVASERGNFRFGPRDKAYAIHFIDDKRGWLVGDMGLAAMTTDGGEHWRQVNFSGSEPRRVLNNGRECGFKG